MLDEDQQQPERLTHASVMTGNPLLRRSVEFPDEQIALDFLAEATVRVSFTVHQRGCCYLCKDVYTKNNGFHLNM